MITNYNIIWSSVKLDEKLDYNYWEFDNYPFKILQYIKEKQVDIIVNPTRSRLFYFFVKFANCKYY